MNFRHEINTILIIGLTFIIHSCSDQKKHSKTIKSPYTSQIDSLMNLMTLEEKIGQTVMYSGGWDKTGPKVSDDNIKHIREGNVGAMLNVYSAKGTRELQQIAIEETRLGIPLLFGYDVIHGHRTIFPINLGLAASWDLKQIENSARIAAEEASAEGIHWTFAPMVDIARDPRWGRISEGAGEDTYLGSQIAKAYVKGFQGNDLAANNTIIACAKHFAGYGAAQAGRDYHTVDMSDGELWNTYLPPFKATVDSGVETFMTAFNDLNGIPASGNQSLFREILREQWNFKGFVVSDYTAINELIPHGFAKNEKDAARLAMNAGVDMDMMGNVNRLYLKKLIEENKVKKETVEEACRKILETKFKLGLFDDPYRYSNEDREKEVIYKKEFLDAARNTAAASSVLLKNDNKTLPITKNKTIALIGPLAKDKESIIGNWAAAGDRYGKAVSIYEGLLEYVDEKNIFYAQGCDILSNDENLFNQAIDAAKKADIIVMVMGEHYHMSGEAASRTNIKLPGLQTTLIKKITEEVPNKQIVLILMNGRPLDLSEEHILTDAILETWFPGTMGGLGIADILFGTYNPSGKLPVTFPRNVGQIPIYYNMKNTGRPINPSNPKEDYKSNYIDVSNTPLYPFGYGLSYTNFEYKVTSSGKQLIPGEEITISVEIKNTGNYDGSEIAQLYIRDKTRSITPPVKELKGFKKVFMKKGESTNLTFTITTENLKFYNQQLDFTYEPGRFEFFVGGSSDLPFTHEFELIEEDK
ncbi:beta-glucosidase BglX [Aquimarina algiphila]|uniref:beta-glucosidase BglX n=1 Tax=Aquimarina algiphila TaxID=2047982 RepID=UPI00232E77C6|nr:beta-glucosidase BglX [Aquimarina algiphila]